MIPWILTHLGQLSGAACGLVIGYLVWQLSTYMLELGRDVRNLQTEMSMKTAEAIRESFESKGESTQTRIHVENILNANMDRLAIELSKGFVVVANRVDEAVSRDVAKISPQFAAENMLMANRLETLIKQLEQRPSPFSNHMVPLVQQKPLVVPHESTIVGEPLAGTVPGWKQVARAVVARSKGLSNANDEVVEKPVEPIGTVFESDRNGELR